MIAWLIAVSLSSLPSTVANTKKLDDGWLSVKEYGVIGDGVTNVTARLQLAITAAATSPGKLFIPAGRYITNANLVIPSNVWIQGAGKNQTIISMTGTGSGGSKYIFHITSAVSNVTVDGITFTTPDTSTAANAGLFIGAAALDVKVQNCEFSNFYNYAMRSNTFGAKRFTFDHNTVHGIWRSDTASGLSPSYLEQSQITNNLIYDIGIGSTPGRVIWGIYASGTGAMSGIVVSNNQLYNTSGGIKVSGSGDPPTPYKAVVIANNTVDRPSAGQAIVIGDINGVTVANNGLRLAGNGEGILIDSDVHSFSITGNTIDFDGLGTSLGAISMGNASASDGTIVGNTLRGLSGNYGIYMTKAVNVGVTGNYFYEFTDGLLLQGTSNVHDITIKGNFFFASATANSKAVATTSNSNIDIENNYLYGSGVTLSWLFDADTVTGMIVKNNIKFGADANLGRVLTSTNVLIEGNVSDADPTLASNTSPVNVVFRNNKKLSDIVSPRDDVAISLTGHAGGGQSGATPLLHQLNVGSCATTGDSFLLPNAVYGGEFLEFYNSGSNSCNLFPQSGENAGGGANTAVAVAGGSAKVFRGRSSALWYNR